MSEASAPEPADVPADVPAEAPTDVDVARAGPARLRELCVELEDADRRRKPGVGKLSIVEHVCHMIEMERAVFGVRLRRILEEENPRLERVDESHAVDAAQWEDREFDELLDAWESARAGNVELVEGAQAEDWERPVQHPDLGETTFAGVVERWSRHDADHLRQVEIIARNSLERNLP